MLRLELFTQIGLDSGALTMLGSIVHPMPEPGHFRGSVQRDEQEVGHFHVRVEEEAERSQIDVDLGRSARRGRADAPRDDEDCSCGGQESRTLRAGGFLLLFVGEGRGGYHVVLSARVGEEREVVYDSRRMVEGDRFAATVLRPGRYEVQNLESQASAKLDVSYPERGDRPYRPADPVTIAVTPRTLRPASISIGPAQGQIYEVRSQARIRIRLIEPYDRTEPREPRRLAKRPAAVAPEIREILRSRRRLS